MRWNETPEPGWAIANSTGGAVAAKAAAAGSGNRPTRPPAAVAARVSADGKLRAVLGDLRDRDALEEVAAGERTEDVRSPSTGAPFVSIAV